MPKEAVQRLDDAHHNKRSGRILLNSQKQLQFQETHIQISYDLDATGRGE